LFTRLEKQLAARQVQPALTHGDFAPWNVKVAADGRWVVLDWERGQLTGPPAWDWFHFVIQPAILVEKLSNESLVGRIEDFLISPAFQKYAQAAGLGGREREWMLAYLLYCREVIKPAEGLPQTSRLLDTLASRWPAN
jgi:aminoglycoside phosphotransferase (APT) family kinase protein